MGLIGYSKTKPYVKIPVLEKASYQELSNLIQAATAEIKYAIGEEFTAFIASMKTRIPKHLTSVSEIYRYSDAAKYFVMAIVREAYDKGLHLKDVNDCCPPLELSRLILEGKNIKFEELPCEDQELTFDTLCQKLKECI